MADIKLYIHEIINEPKNRITISSPQLPTLTAFVDADTDFGVNATYSAGDWSTTAPKAGADLANKGLGHTQYRVSNAAMSKLSWTHSALSSLSFDLFFVAYEEGHNPLNDAVKVFQYTLPAGYVTGIETTPGGYSTGGIFTGSDVSNACDILIGDWFKSHNCWVMEDAKISVSKKKQPDGVKPLYVKVTVTMKPVRDFHAEEVMAWFAPGLS